jgi:FMN-dependent NADH-azoreductase
MNILHILANPQPTEEAASKQIAVKFFMKVAELGGETEVVNVDLYQEPPPPVSYEQYKNFWYPVTIEGYVPTKQDIAASKYALDQAERVNAADALVLSMPMWNFGIPGVVKSWLDHIMCPGLLYDLTAEGPKPKHKLKHVILLVSSADVFKEGDPRDALSPAISTMFEYIGVEDISFAWADGQNPAQHSDGEARKRMAVEMAEELAEEVLESNGQPA